MPDLPSMHSPDPIALFIMPLFSPPPSKSLQLTKLRIDDSLAFRPRILIIEFANKSPNLRN